MKRLQARDASAEDAGRGYEAALALARRQRSTTLAMRAALDLCRSCRDRGLRARTRQPLAQVLVSLDDSVAIPEVGDARRLLAELT